MNASSAKILTASFIGCTKSLFEIAFLTDRICHTTDDPYLLWYSILNGEIERPADTGSLNQNYPEKPLQNAHFMFVVENISHHCFQNVLRKYNRAEEARRLNSGITSNLNDQFITPPELLADRDVAEKWKKLQQKISDFISCCVEKGISTQDAGLSLPLAALPRELLTFDFQTLQRFLENEMCEKTPWETKSLAWQIYEVMKEEFPILAQRLGIKCWETRQMYCSESYTKYKKCRFGNGFRPHKNNLEDIWYANAEQPENKNTLSF